MFSRAEFTHNRAAYAKEDVEDSKRGRPDFDLKGYARMRGLQFRDSVRMGAFMSASPIWPDYVFNAMDGRLPSGRYGLIEHELDQQALDQDGIEQGGSYYSTRYTWRNPQDWKAFLTSGLLGSERKTPNEPFAGNSVWLPASAVSVRVPETNGIGFLDIRRKGNYPRWGVRDLSELGLPGFRATGVDGGDPDEDVVAEALRGRAGDALRDIGHPYIRVEVGYGVVTLRRNGFASEEELADLVGRAEGIAEGFAAACGRLAAPQAFEQPLPDPPAGPELSRKQAALAEIADIGVGKAAERIGRELGMQVESPATYHRAFPRVPMPGRARLVVAGTLPGTSAYGRVVFTTQGRRAGTTLRGGLLLEAAPGAAETPLGGTVLESTGMYGEVADGLATIWDKRRVTGHLDAEDVIRRGIQTARELGIASV